VGSNPATPTIYLFDIPAQFTSSPFDARITSRVGDHLVTTKAELGAADPNEDSLAESIKLRGGVKSKSAGHAALAKKVFPLSNYLIGRG
jgi:hypothetical protein